METEIVNRVANSSLVTLDLEDYILDVERESLDIADFLFQRMLLKEKDFREMVRTFDWTSYQDKAVNVYCSEEAIIPAWAYMVIVSKLEPIAWEVILGAKVDLDRLIIDRSIERIPQEVFEGKKIVVKGCGNLSLRDYAYFQVSKRILPYVQTLMYGEPCSTVPVYKKKVLK